MAAGALLVREAGGLVGDLDGNEGFLDSGRIVASNAKLFSPILQVLKQKG
jgi:myo-inositol-1(or 4)-monophosphatase